MAGAAMEIVASRSTEPAKASLTVFEPANTPKVFVGDQEAVLPSAANQYEPRARLCQEPIEGFER